MKYDNCLFQKDHQRTDLIPDKPGLLVRMAIPVLLAVLLLIVGGSLWMKYPEKVLGRGVVMQIPKGKAQFYVDVTIKRRYFNKLRSRRSAFFVFRVDSLAAASAINDFIFLPQQMTDDSFTIRIHLVGKCPTSMRPFEVLMSLGYVSLYQKIFQA